MTAARLSAACVPHVAHPAQRASHAMLTCTHRPRGAATVQPGRLDAVIVPASRGAAAVDGAADLAARFGATLVALCSRETRAHAVVERAARRTGSRTVAVDVPVGYRHALMPTRTVAPPFRAAAADRTSDLSVKRNVGLLLARLHDWGKIVFLDDDIGSVVDGRPSGPSDRSVRRIVAALDTHQIAGLSPRQFPDNSVVCHARRLAGFEQDTFISGASVGVNCHDHPLPFFPDQYNEDWFFFSKRVAARDIAQVGNAVQAEYDPFASPHRARREEFGDLVAEGLFALFEGQPPEMDYRRRLAAADLRYWERFIADRHDLIGETGIALASGSGNPTVGTVRSAALRSLAAAGGQLSRLTPELCVDFLAAWVDDLAEWERATERMRPVRSTSEALGELGLRRGIVEEGVLRAAAWT